MAGAMLGIAGRAFFVATKALGKTGLTFSPMLLGDYVLNDSKITKAAAAKGWEGVLHPIDTFNRVKGVIDEKKAAVDHARQTYGEIKAAGADALETAGGVLHGDAAAREKAAAAIKATAAKAKGKAGEVFDAAVHGKSDGEGSDHEGSSWGKKLGWGAAFLGSGWLAKTLFFGGKKKDKDKENDSGIGFGTLLKIAIAGFAVMVTFNNWDFIKGKFNEYAGNLFGKDSPTVAQRLTSDPTGRTNTAAFVPTEPPATTLVVNTPPANPHSVARSFEESQTRAALATQAAIAKAKTPVAGEFDKVVTADAKAESDKLMARMRAGQPEITAEQTFDHS